jgi:small neutral amino acid transporter SnatA (MarC family)
MANLIERLLRKTGALLASHVLGMLLTALSVQFILIELNSFGTTGV